LKQSFINKKQLFGLIEDHFFNEITDKVLIKEIEPWELLTPNRLDVCFKLFFLKNRNKISFAEKFYKDHISVMTNGLFKEFGNPQKNSFKIFKKKFIDLEIEMRNNHFDDSKSLIPTGKNHTILDGAHRLSISILNNLKLKTIKTNIEDSNYNWNFFLQRGIKLDDIEIAVSEFCNYNKKIHVALIWPVSKEFTVKIIDEFEPNSIVYIKKLKLTNHAFKNILIQVYKDHSWLGQIEKGYDGIISKFSKIYKPHGELTIVFFTSESLKQVIDLKEKIRNFIGLEKHSIHITDNKTEAITVSKIFLNHNALEFYNNSNNFKFPESHKLFISFKNELVNNGYDLNDFIVVGSMPFSLQGIIEANDIDYITSINFKTSNKKFNTHNKYLFDYGVELNELIYNPKNFFIYEGIKFISNELNLKFKKSRGEVKDKLLIKKLKKENSISTLFLEFENFIINIKYKIIVLIIKYSKLTGTYNFFKSIYKKI